jgi:hypothetical protein
MDEQAGRCDVAHETEESDDIGSQSDAEHDFDDRGDDPVDNLLDECPVIHCF